MGYLIELNPIAKWQAWKVKMQQEVLHNSTYCCCCKGFSSVYMCVCVRWTYYYLVSSLLYMSRRLDALASC